MANENNLVSLSEILRLIKSLDILHPESLVEKDLLFFIVRWIRISRLCKEHMQLSQVSYEQKKSCTTQLQRFSTEIIPLLQNYHTKIKTLSYEQKILTFSTQLGFFRTNIQKYQPHNPYFAYDFLVDELVFVDLWKLDIPDQILQQTRADLVIDQQNLRSDIAQRKFPQLNKFVYDTHISMQKTQRSIHQWWNRQKTQLQQNEQKLKNVENKTQQYSRQLKHNINEKANQIASFTRDKIKSTRNRVKLPVTSHPPTAQETDRNTDLKMESGNITYSDSIASKPPIVAFPPTTPSPSISIHAETVNFESDLETFKRVLSEHSRISMNDMAQAMNISNDLLFEKMVNWQNLYLFVVEGDTIINTINSPYLSSLDHEFKEWEQGIQK